MKNISNLLIRHSNRCTKLLLFISLLIFNFYNCVGQEQENISTPFRKFNKFKAYIEKRMESTRTPSISIAIAQSSKILYKESFGWADREKKNKATPLTTYSTASISKPMTATAMMILVERGLIDLNEPVNSYLEKSNLIAYEGNVSDATIARLLHHTAGLPAIWNFYFD